MQTISDDFLINLFTPVPMSEIEINNDDDESYLLTNDNKDLYARFCHLTKFMTKYQVCFYYFFSFIAVSFFKKIL